MIEPFGYGGQDRNQGTVPQAQMTKPFRKPGAAGAVHYLPNTMHLYGPPKIGNAGRSQVRPSAHVHHEQQRIVSPAIRNNDTPDLVAFQPRFQLAEFSQIK